MLKRNEPRITNGKSSVVLILLLLLVILPLRAYSKDLSIHFDNIPVESGLTNKWVIDVVQDKQGFIWAGYQFRKFHHNQKDSHSLYSSYIQTLSYIWSRRTKHALLISV